MRWSRGWTLLLVACLAGCFGALDGPDAVVSERMQHGAKVPAPHELSFEGQVGRLRGEGFRFSLATATVGFAAGTSQCGATSPRPASLGEVLVLGRAGATFEPADPAVPPVRVDAGWVSVWADGPRTATAPIAYELPQVELGEGSLLAQRYAFGAATATIPEGGVRMDDVWMQGLQCDTLTGPGRLTLEAGTGPFVHALLVDGSLSFQLDETNATVIDLGPTNGIATTKEGLHWDPKALRLLATRVDGTVDVASGFTTLEATVEQAWSNLIAFPATLRLATLDGEDELALEVARGGRTDVWLRLRETTGHGTAIGPVLLARHDDLGDDIAVSLSRALADAPDLTPPDSGFVTQRRVFWDGDDGHTLDPIRYGQQGYVVLRVEAAADAERGTERFDVELHQDGLASQPLVLTVKVV